MQSDTKPASRASELRDEINRANRLYYVEDAPGLDDAEWDARMQELLALEEAHPELKTPDSPSQRVGAPPSSGFDEVVHPVPMLSLGNVFNEEGLSAWYRRALDYLELDSAAMVCELKIDGLALAVTPVIHGRYARLVRRIGDGHPDKAAHDRFAFASGF